MRSNRIAVTAGVALVFAACGGSAPGGAPGPAWAEPGDSLAAAGATTAGSMRGDRGHYENVLEMIRGRAPGLEVLELGGGVIQVRIRGLNQSLQTNADGAPVGQEPLVVVDGVPSHRPAGEILLSLVPTDVASIEVLKDVASTTIYGTRGANGVILVSMRRRD